MELTSEPVSAVPKRVCLRVVGEFGTELVLVEPVRECVDICNSSSTGSRTAGVGVVYWDDAIR